MSVEIGQDPRFPVIDYVLVYSALNLDLQTPRDLFEAAILRDGLKIDRETIGNNVFLKIICPFPRLAQQAERIKLEMPIKGAYIKPSEPNCCLTLQNIMTTDDEVDFVSAPFEVEKLHLYESSEDKSTFFRPALRSYLVHNILINLDIKDYLKKEDENEEDDIVSKRGLLYLLMKKAYTDAFVLHDPSAEEPYYLKIKEKSLEEYYLQIPKTKCDARRDMNITWVKFWKFQPLWKVRNYFGEKIAFYFAWEGTFLTLLWIPAFLGLIIFVYGLVLSIENNELQSCQSGSVAQNVSNMTTTTTLSPIQCNSIAHFKQLGEDVLGIVKEAFDNLLTPFFSLIICIWGSLFLEIWKRNNYTLAYQWDVDSYEQAEPDRPEFFGTKQKPDPITGELAWFYPISQRIRKFFVSTVVSVLMICIVFVSVCCVIAFKVAMRVKYNCPIDDGDENNTQIGEGSPAVTCLFLVTVVPAVLNAVSILMLGNIYSIVAERLTFWENHRTQTEYNDSMIIKLFAFQFVNTYTSLFYIAFFRPMEHGFQDNGVFGWGEKYRDTCTSTTGHCMSLLSFQILVLMIVKPFPKFFKDIVVPWLKRKYRRTRRMMRRKKVEDATETGDRPNTGSKHEEPELTVKNFLEREFLKPKLYDFTMGEYTEKVIQFGYIMLFAASFPLAPFLALIINLFDLRVDARRLLWWNRRPVAFIASHIGMWFPILRFVNFCGVVSNAFLVGFTSSFCQNFFDPGTPCTTEKRLAIIIVFEHLVFVSMYLISIIIPDIPAAIRLAQRRERYQVTKIMEQGLQSTKNSVAADSTELIKEQLTAENNWCSNINGSSGYTGSSGESEKQHLICRDELQNSVEEAVLKGHPAEAKNKKKKGVNMKNDSGYNMKTFTDKSSL